MPPGSPIASSLAHVVIWESGVAACTSATALRHAAHTYNPHVIFFCVYTLQCFHSNKPAPSMLENFPLLRICSVTPVLSQCPHYEQVAAVCVSISCLSVILKCPQVTFEHFLLITVCDKRISYKEVKIVTCYLSERRLFAFIILS